MNTDVSEADGMAAMRKHFDGRDGFGMEMGDSTLRRYLVARKFEIEKAIEMLEKTLKWREKIGVKDMMQNWMGDMATECATGKIVIRGYDHEGRVLVQAQPKYENTLGQHDANIRHFVFQLEKAVACMPEGQEKWLLVTDFDSKWLYNHVMHSCSHYS